MEVPTHLTPWPQNKALRASINNFGYGGTNAHVILESAPAAELRWNGINGNSTTGVYEHSANDLNGHPTNGMNGKSANRGNRHATSGLKSNSLNGVTEYTPYQSETLNPDRSRVYILSAKDSATCRRIAQGLAVYLLQSIKEDHEPPACDLAYTLSTRRTHLPWMVATRSRNLRELAQRLEEPSAKPLNCAKQPRLGFVFNGQGAQWYAMGRELITAYPIFGASIQKADQVLRDYGANWSLYGMLEMGAQRFRAWY